MIDEIQLSDKQITKAKLLGSFKLFTQIFFELRKGEKYNFSVPKGRECRHIISMRAYRKVFDGEIKRLIITYPPRYGKTEDAVHFMAWATANNPKCNWIYTSYSKDVASRQTQALRDIISMPYYKNTFDVHLDPDTSAKHNFKTTVGGEVLGVGAGGSITSRGAGVAYNGSGYVFGGAIIVDDILKPVESFSDTIREERNFWFYNTLFSRLNDPIRTPIIVIAQRLHEDDLIAKLQKERDVHGELIWTVVHLPARDDNGNVLDETKHTLEMLNEMERIDRYTFWSQMQGNPQPPGGGIFKKDDFLLLPLEPDIISTFITADTAETDKSWNDATAFSFWGVYKIIHRGIDTGLYALHWLDCREIRVEPRDLENEFFDFYTSCMRHRSKPGTACIEKKSTGVTMCSTLKGIPGLRIMEIDRNISHGTKTARFYEMQPFIASHRITFTAGAKHAQMCIDHMAKITGNNSHAHDDICDTAEIACRAALIEGTLLPRVDSHSKILQVFKNDLDRRNHLRNRL